MSSSKALQLNPQLTSILSSYWQWRKLWILTTLAFCVIGLAYSVLLKSDSWKATQALIVRDEATGAVMRLGRFESQTQMKASQETVLEMARNPQVVEAALKVVGRPDKFFGLLKNDSPPSRAEIEDIANSAVTVRAPRGAELGTTEVIYLDVKQHSKERALKLASAICEALENQLKAVRVELATGVIQELEAAKSVCEASLQEATDELQKIEVEVGSDLADLRGLSDSTVGSTNRLMLDLIRDELRKADLAVRTMEPNYELAKAALENPSLVLQAAEILKDAHPAISRLRDGLAEARVKTANMEGKYTGNHAEVVNARQVEAAFQNNIMRELANVVQGYQASIGISQQKINALNDQEIELGKRLNRLADVRGKYSNVVAEVKSRADTLSQIKKELIQAIASRDAAMAASLLTRLDSPVIGEKPVGPGRTTIVGGATVGGLMLGLGVVFLLVPLDGRVPPNNSNSATGNTGMASYDRSRNLAPATTDLKNQYARDTTPERSVSSANTTTATNIEQPLATPSYPVQTTMQASRNESSPALSSQPTSPVVKPKEATSATWAAKSMESKRTVKPESVDEVRDLIANALKCHAKSPNDSTSH